MTEPQEAASAGARRAELLLAFVFGAFFCAVLAYAGLRDKPITDPGQFFLLRVLAAISAAGVAAVIPGMLHIEVGRQGMFAIRGAGALAVFTLVFAVNPPELLRSAGEAQRAMMSGNYSQGLYDDAGRIADEILRADPNDAQALNIKGGIAFYRGDYASAVEYFQKARLSRPNYQQYASNYANALIEVKAYKQALEVFQKINDGSRDRSYGLGRAYFYAGAYDEANKTLEAVPSDYWHGAGRMLEAASLLARAESESDSGRKADLLSTARKKFHEAYVVDRSYWNGILSRKQKDQHQGYEKLLDLVGPLYSQIVSSK